MEQRDISLDRAISTNMSAERAIYDSRHYTNYKSPRDAWHAARSSMGISPTAMKDFLTNNAMLINKMHILNNFTNSATPRSR
jgi:hypothetical protein